MRSFPWLAALLMMTAPSSAVDRTFENSVESTLKAGLSSNWFLRASWRGETLVVFVSPPPVVSSITSYGADRQMTLAADLCKAIPQAIWDKIGAGQDIGVEPIIGGNGGRGSWRLSCRAYLSNGKAETSIRSN
jgi:hypothetical protein